ncbi:hypothetical protein CC80DRAFT_597369 [Byssothecium circinans]|uniref:Uncharacterized protein n=1 Tax=Byssothecium circinans TaxID=147558 RepID=A0A6A5TIE2_9PLEO|nr:hypothetical protein CC80DRAFT_597369 [Byssothecium circinans]
MPGRLPDELLAQVVQWVRVLPPVLPEGLFYYVDLEELEALYAGIEDLLALSLVAKHTRAVVLEHFTRDISISWCEVPSLVLMLVMYPDLAKKTKTLKIGKSDDANTIQLPTDKSFLRACLPIVRDSGLDYSSRIEWQRDLQSGRTRATFAMLFALMTNLEVLDMRDSHLWRFPFLNSIFKAPTRGWHDWYQPYEWKAGYLDRIFVSRCQTLQQLDLPHDWSTLTSKALKHRDPTQLQIPVFQFSMFTNVTRLVAPESAFDNKQVSRRQIPGDTVVMYDRHVTVPLQMTGAPFAQNLATLFPASLKHLTIFKVDFDTQFRRRNYRILELLEFVIKGRCRVPSFGHAALPALERITVEYEQVYPHDFFTKASFATGLFFHENHLFNEWARYELMQQQCKDGGRRYGVELEFGSPWGTDLESWP